jgi:hypothetical protein
MEDPACVRGAMLVVVIGAVDRGALSGLAR